jgi:hypothetical protein
MTAESQTGSASQARLARSERRNGRGWAAFRWLQTPAGLGAVVGLGLGLLILGPGLARGFLLSYDMVFVPAPPFSAALIGFSGGPARAVPSDAVIAVASRVLPADLVQKLVLLFIFAGACSGAAALIAAGWRAAAGWRGPAERRAAGSRPVPVLACLAGGVFYTWNPYVAERLLIGQWALLLGYAGLPWVMREVCTGPVRIRPGRLLLALLPAAVGGFAAMTVTGLAIVPASVLRGTWPERGRRLVTVGAALVLFSLPWLIPSLARPVHTSPAGVNLFAARSDTPFGRVGSLVLLSGIWNSQTVPRGYGGAVTFFWLLVVICALAGYVLLARKPRPWPGIGVAGLIGLLIAAIGTTSPTRAALRDLVAAWPGFAVLRDGQQFVAALALTEAVGLGAAVAWVMQRNWSGASAGSRTATAPRRSIEPAAAALAVLALLAPVLLLPGLAWGEAGRIRPVQYPDDWLAARRLIDGSRQPGSVLVLPWGAYRRYPWNNGGEAVYDPWNESLSREVISDDGLQVGHQTLPPESPASIRLSRIVTAPGPMTGPLQAAGVRFVVVDAGPLLGAPRGALDSDARLPGARVVLDSRDLIVFRLS